MHVRNYYNFYIFNASLDLVLVLYINFSVGSCNGGKGISTYPKQVLDKRRSCGTATALTHMMHDLGESCCRGQSSSSSLQEVVIKRNSDCSKLN